MRLANIAMLVMVFFVAALLGSPALAVTPDKVESADIKEADGTSGQDTNIGSGIKTGHIQEGAVTDSKITGPISGSKLGSHQHSGADISDGTVTNSKITDGAVTDSKITGPISGSKLGSHQHSGADISDGTVTNSKIADGAVTDSKITGPISASKISSTGLDADTIDGEHATDLAPIVHTHSGADISGTIGVDKLATYQNVKVVHKGPADDMNVFNTVSGALASITDASEGNPYIVYVMPGVYVDRFVTKDYVTIKGAGKEITKITTDTYPGGWVGTVDIQSDNSPIEGMTIENTNSTIAIAVTTLHARAKINDCNIIANGADQAKAFAYGNLAYSIRHSMVSATGARSVFGVFAVNGAMENGSIIEDSEFYASGNGSGYGLHINNGMGTEIIGSTIITDGAGIRVFGSSTVVRIKDSNLSSGAIEGSGTLMMVNSLLEGSIVIGLGNNTLRFFNCFDSNLDPIPNQ